MAQEVITILGGGSWGTALAVALSGRYERVLLWVHNHELAMRMEATRENEVYLPGFVLPENVRVVTEMEFGGHAMCVVPSKHLRGVMEQAAGAGGGEARWISATKGIEAGSFKRMSEIIAECVGGVPAVLSGPTFAREIAAGEPAAVVIASEDAEFAQELQGAWTGGNLRFYTNRDVVGVELCGALKNVIAIAAGVAEGLHLGSNTRAALVTRGLAEIGRLVVACGGEANTVAGLAGLGDLVLTCTGALSRNRRVGMELARGKNMATILSETRMVAEGVETTEVALELAATRGVEMPIASAVGKMLGGMAPMEALRELVGRAPKSE